MVLPPGCGSSLQPGDGPIRTFVDQHSVKATIDLIVVVDDSSAIAPFADTLEASFSDFAHVFERMTDGLPSLHAAFVPATLSSGACVGQGARGASCGLSAPFATVDGCGANPNFPGTMESAFACLGRFGSSGCGGPTPLAALRRALGGDGPQSSLAGPTAFLRPDAYLAVVIVSSADDASAPDGSAVPVQEYIDFVKSLKTDPANTVLVSAIAASSFGDAPRLAEFVQSFGGNGLYYPLAVGQGFAAALRSLAESWGDESAPICATGVRDLDPTVPGLQPDCVAENWFSAVEGASLHHVHAPMPSCDVASPPCWRLSAPTGAVNCPTGAWVLTLDRGTDWCRQFEAKTVVSCRGCTDPNDPACAGP